MGGLRATLTLSWKSGDRLGFKLGVRGPSWLQVGGSGGYLGSKLGDLGAILAPSWGVWGSSWLQVGGSGGHLGSKLRGLGAILAPSWGVWGHLGPKLGGLGPSWLHVGGSGGHLGAKSENDLQRSIVVPPPGARFLRHLPRGLLIFISG